MPHCHFCLIFQTELEDLASHAFSFPSISTPLAICSSLLAWNTMHIILPITSPTLTMWFIYGCFYIVGIFAWMFNRHLNNKMPQIEAIFPVSCPLPTTTLHNCPWHPHTSIFPSFKPCIHSLLFIFPSSLYPPANPMSSVLKRPPELRLGLCSNALCAERVSAQEAAPAPRSQSPFLTCSSWHLAPYVFA